jgi:hypothetical protein
MVLITFQPSLLKKLRNAEHFFLFENIVIGIPDGLTLAPLQAPWSSFLTSFGKEDEIYKRSAKQEETVLVQDAHEKRRTALTVVKRTVGLGLYSESLPVKEAATALDTLLNNYAAASTAPMNEVASLVINLLQDLAKPRHAAQVALVAGLSGAIDRLKRENDAFVSLYAERTLGEEETKNQGSLYEARLVTDQHFAVLVDAINVCYRYNELLPSPDATVKATLANAILVINSFLHKYAAIYARRNPKYHPSEGGSQPSVPGGDEPEPPALPQIAIAAQNILGNSSVIAGAGTQMSLVASDAAVFAAALHPEALGGDLRMLDPETDVFVDFPIADFLLDGDGETPIGLVVDAPDASTAFEKPFYGLGLVQAEVAKEDVVLAVLDGVEYPATARVG